MGSRDKKSRGKIEIGRHHDREPKFSSAEIKCVMKSKGEDT